MEANAAAARGDTLGGSLAVHVRVEDLASETGVDPAEAERVIVRLERLRIARRHGQHTITVADVGRLLEFLEFLESPERHGNG